MGNELKNLLTYKLTNYNAYETECFWNESKRMGHGSLDEYGSLHHCVQRQR